MSETIPTNSLKTAQAFNELNAAGVLRAGLPDIVTRSYPGVTAPYNSAEFVHAVRALQKDLGVRIDGKLGHETYIAALREHESVPDDCDYVTYNRRRFRLYPRTYKIFGYDNTAQGLDLHPAGYFSLRNTDIGIDTIVLHWGGFNPRSLYNVMSADRPVSTHFGIGLDEANQPTVYQYLDIKHKAWHAGPENDGSIGIDICQQPVTKHLAMYQREGYHVRVVQNTTGRGNDRVLSLDPRIAAATFDFVQDLASIMKIQLKAPPSHAVLPEGVRYSLVGHHHVNPQKWDIACWWEEIFAGSPLRITGGS